MTSARYCAPLLTALLWTALLCAGAPAAAAFAAADPNKVLHVSFEQSDDGFDVQRVNNLYSHWAAEAIFESLLTYDYLARPAKLVPRVAQAMPEISADGKTYLLRIRQGVYFAPDPVFKGVRRELTAADFVYTIKRLVDPKIRAPEAAAFEGKIVGLDDLIAAARQSGAFDYERPIAGLETPDRYTLRMRLNAPDQTMSYHLAHPSVAAVAREVVEYYGEDSGRHPVGTGAYMLKQYVPRSKIVLVANPQYRGFTWDFKPSGAAWDEKIVRDMQGKRMPQIGRVEISIIEEEQARWLAFDSGQLDIEQLSDSAAPTVLDGKNLKPAYAARHIALYRYTEPGITYTLMNFKNPVIGGFGKEKIALRRAIAMAYRVDDEIAQVRFGQAVRGQSHIPPDLSGFDPNYRTSIAYDPALAGKLLDRFGYKRGADGYRTMPDGKPLLLKITSQPNARDKARMEIWKRSLDPIGIRAEYPVSNFADNVKAAYRCELMMWGLGGTAGIPDGIDFLDSYYGPNVGRGNRSCYASPVFDDMFRKARLLPDGPQRQALYNRMQRQLEADTVDALHLWRIRNWLVQPWVQGYKKHPIVHGDWQYLDIDQH